MNGITRLLAGLALMSALFASLLLAATAEELSLSAILEPIVGHAKSSFVAPAWSWLLSLTGVAVSISLTLKGVAFLLSIPERRSRVAFSQADASTVREHVSETRDRIQYLAALTEPDIIELVNELVRGAGRVHASDIHMSPSPQGLRLTYRVGGLLHEVCDLPRSFAALIATRVKVMSRLDTYVRNVPQDGRLVVQVEGGTIEARVSTLPADGEERIVLRLVRGSRTPPDLEALGLADPLVTALTELLDKPQGLLFVCGPVGSGKTTTLYAAVKHIAKKRGRTATLVTLEDPIELELDFATQTQINAKAQMTFARTLRSVLRQDPNVLMVGEIRDSETAGIAVQAGLTGHLILTTIHGENAAAPFARLAEMGVPSYALASATLGSLSQRLVRLLCTHCRKEAEPSDEMRARFEKHGIRLKADRYYEPVGCAFCEDQGFTGQAPIGELLIVDPTLRRLIHERVPTTVIYDEARRLGLSTTLLQDGLARAERGETSLAEVLRAAG